MSPLQKLLATVLGGLVLSLMVVLAGVAYVRGGGSARVTLTQAPNATSTIPTIDDKPPPVEKDLVEETTTTSTTTTTTIPGFVTTPATSAPPTTRVAETVGSSNAVLSSGSGTTRQLNPGAGCSGLADPGATEVRCEQFRSRGTELIWLTQSTREGVLGSGRGRSALVFRRTGTTSWAVALERQDPDGSQFRSITVRLADVSGDGSQDAVFGFRSSSGSLGVDVVEGPGLVLAHRDATGGSARVSPGQIDIWSASGATAIHEVIRVVEGSYRVVSTEQVPAGAVPPSQL